MNVIENTINCKAIQSSQNGGILSPKREVSATLIHKKTLQEANNVLLTWSTKPWEEKTLKIQNPNPIHSLVQSILYMCIYSSLLFYKFFGIIICTNLYGKIN